MYQCISVYLIQWEIVINKVIARVIYCEPAKSTRNLVRLTARFGLLMIMETVRGATYKI